MQAYHNKESVKKKYLARVVAHHKADEIVKGRYWEEGKGCAVGCTVHSDQHGAYETELGIPTWLAKLEDRLFEGVSNKYAVTFPEKFLKAIKPGANLDSIKNEFLYFVVNGTLKHFDHKKCPACKKAIVNVGKALKSNEMGEDVWVGLRSAAAAYAAAATKRQQAREKEYERMATHLLKLLKRCV